MKTTWKLLSQCNSFGVLYSKRQLDDVVVTNRLSFAWKGRYPKREESSQHSAQSRGSVPQKWK